MRDRKEKDKDNLHESALRLLSRREHSYDELFNKLIDRGFESSSVVQVLNEFIQLDYLSNARYAKNMVVHRSKNGYGPIYIKKELKTKGVDSAIIEDAFTESGICWSTVAASRYRSHFQDSDIKDFSDWSKRASYLRRRGFELDIIHQILGEWQSNC